MHKNGVGELTFMDTQEMKLRAEEEEKEEKAYRMWNFACPSFSTSQQVRRRRRRARYCRAIGCWESESIGNNGTKIPERDCSCTETRAMPHRTILLIPLLLNGRLTRNQRVAHSIFTSLLVHHVWFTEITIYRCIYHARNSCILHFVGISETSK